MGEISRLIKRVQKFVAKRGAVKWRLARRANLSENALKDCDKPDWNPRAETLERVVRAVEELEAEEAAEKRRSKSPDEEKAAA